MPAAHEATRTHINPAPAGAGPNGLFLVGDRWGRVGQRGARLVHSQEDLLRGFAEGPRNSVWVAQATTLFSALATSRVRGSSDRRLIVLGPLQEIARHVLMTWFRHVVVARDGISLLGTPELLEVLTASNRDELFIGGGYDSAGKVVLLYRGSVEPLAVPASWFKDGPAGAGKSRARIDPRSVLVTDHGQAIRLGDHEVATDAILYEFDEEYRRKARRRSLLADDSMGASIRRLRLQKGLTQSDFGLPLKTIARIERGEVLRPRPATLRRIARRLNVSVEALGTF